LRITILLSRFIVVFNGRSEREMTCSRQKVTGEMFENFYRQIMADGFDEKTADNLPDRKFKNFDLFCPLPAGSVN